METSEQVGWPYALKSAAWPIREGTLASQEQLEKELVKAVQDGEFARVQELIASGADVETRNPKVETRTPKNSQVSCLHAVLHLSMFVWPTPRTMSPCYRWRFRMDTRPLLLRSSKQAPMSTRVACVLPGCACWR